MAISNSYFKLPEGIHVQFNMTMGNHGNINHLMSFPCEYSALSWAAVMMFCRAILADKWGAPVDSHRSTMCGPPVMERWFINPMNTIVIGTINHSEIGVINQLTIVIGNINHSEIGVMCTNLISYM